jgi:hypothetical protein
MYEAIVVVTNASAVSAAGVSVAAARGCRRGWRQPIQCFAAADGAMGAAAMQEGGGGGEQQAFEIENMW